MSGPATITYEGAVEALRACVAATAKLPEGEISTSAAFSDYGLDSLEVIEVVANLEKVLGRPLPPTLLYEYPSIHEAAEHLVGTARPARQ